MKKIMKSNQSIKADRFDDVWDQVKDINQEFSSADTSINSKKLPAVYNLINIPEGSVVLDYGGGRFTNVCDYYSQYNIAVLIFDPFNQSSEHNQEVIQKLRDIGGADIAVCSNVLNVIKEPANRLQVLENIKKLIKPGAPVYITVYEGKGNGEEGPTKSGYQLNKKTKDYLEEIQEVFPEAKRKGKLIMASTRLTKKSSITASKATDYDEINSYYYRGQKYMVYDTKSDDPNLPGYEMFSIDEVHPYDDAEYAWISYDAANNSNYAYIIRNGKIEDKIAVSTWGDNEDYYEFLDDFRDDVIDQLIDELRDSNKDVKPLMINMSTKARGSKITASHQKITAANEDLFSADDFGDVDDDNATDDSNLDDVDDDATEEIPEIDSTDIDTDNNITDHYIAECEQCHGIFISSLKESEEGITSITGICPLCNKKTTQYLKWVVRDNDTPVDSEEV